MKRFILLGLMLATLSGCAQWPLNFPGIRTAAADETSPEPSAASDEATDAAEATAQAAQDLAESQTIQADTRPPQPDSPPLEPSQQGAPETSPLVGETPAIMHDRHMSKLNTIKQFTVHVRIAVQTEARSFSGATRWRHQPDRDDIAVLSPLGGQIASIQKTAHTVEMKTSDGKEYRADDIEALTEEALGWRLPLSGLSYWIVGRPTPKVAEKIEWNRLGQITRLEQDGWVIEYPQYAQEGEWMLPKKILMLSQKLNLKLVLQSWPELSMQASTDAQVPPAESTQ